jgi:hypothetical protein
VSRVIFLVVALLAWGGMHYYVWRRLFVNTALPRRWRRTGAAIVIVLALLAPVSFILWRVGKEQTVSAILYWPAMIWLGLLFLLLMALLAGDLVRLGLGIGRRVMRKGPVDPSRRVFLSRVVSGAAVAAAGTAGAAAVYGALGPVRIERVRVRLPRLPRSMNGTTIVQLTDMHIGPTIGRGFSEDIVRRVNALRPDLVAITGDMVDGSVDDLRRSVEPLADLKSRFGTYFVTGNHEYYSGAEEWIAYLPRMGMRVLENEHVPLDGIDLAGINDYTARGNGSSREDLERALRGRDPSRELVLLSHQPRSARQASLQSVGLQLSGHTHGGQIWPWRYMVYLQQPFVSGLGRYGSTWVYTSCGTGYWGPPMRLGAPAEITLVTLEAEV